MNEFKVGDLVKVKGENIVFKLAGFAHGMRLTPDGWLIGAEYCGYSPEKCELYKGAISVFKGDDDE